ncbi:MAG: NADH-quinone oxidoreductase subunit C [Acidimicrobiales bacterium]
MTPLSSSDVVDDPQTDGGSDDEAAVEPDPRRDALLAILTEGLGDDLVESHLVGGVDLWVRVRREAWRRAADVASTEAGCRWFDWLGAIDWLPSPFGRDMESEQDWAVHGREEKEPVEMVTGFAGGDTRFQVLMRLFSITSNVGVTIKTDLPDDDVSVETLIPVFAGANWHERETHEMYGIDFVGHPDLRNLYLPGAFEGYPMRKDFPLLARRVKPWPGIVDVEAMPGEGDDA